MPEPEITPKRILDLLDKLEMEIKESRAAWNAELASALDARRQMYAVTRTEDGEDYDVYFYDRKGEPIPASAVTIVFMGELFCVARIQGRTYSSVTLFSEDDGNYFELSSFHQDWLQDLSKVAATAYTAIQQGDA